MWSLLVYPIPLFFVSVSGRSSDMTEIVLAGSLRLNLVNQSCTIMPN